MPLGKCIVYQPGDILHYWILHDKYCMALILQRTRSVGQSGPKYSCFLKQQKVTKKRTKKKGKKIGKKNEKWNENVPFCVPFFIPFFGWFMKSEWEGQGCNCMYYCWFFQLLGKFWSSFSLNSVRLCQKYVIQINLTVFKWDFKDETSSPWL